MQSGVPIGIDEKKKSLHLMHIMHVSNLTYSCTTNIR